MTNNVFINSNINNNNTTKNLMMPISERNSISIAKKHNSIGFNTFQKKLSKIPSYKILDSNKKTTNNLLNSNTISGNNTNLGLMSNSNVNSNKNLENKEKDTLNNTNATHPEQNTGRISLVSGGNDISINQLSLLENKNCLSTNVYNTLNTFSHQNSLNNISSTSDSSHIKVTVRFRPMNNVENVRSFFTLIIYFKTKF